MNSNFTSLLYVTLLIYDADHVLAQSELGKQTLDHLSIRWILDSSTLLKNNCGKSLTLYLLSKLQGLATRHHPLLLSGGNQSTSGTSAYVSSIFSDIFKAGKRICWERFQPKYKCTLFLLSSGINNCLLKAIFECHLPNTIQTLLVGPLKHAIKKKMASRVRIIHEYKNVDD